MRKLIASTTIAASLIGGGATAIVLAPTFAGAQDDSGTEADPTPADDTGSDAGSESTDDDSRLGDWVADALAPLVEDGTLTQAQADAVGDALEAARPERGFGDHHGGPGGRGGFGLDVLEELGLDPETVREGLMNGSTLGEIAEANGISADDVVAAIVESMNTRLDEAVAEGRITQEEADEYAADIAERAAAIVAGEMPEGDRGGFGDRGRGHGPFGDRDDSGDEGDSTDEGTDSGTAGTADEGVGEA